MELLYRIFYTVFSMSCMAAVLLPAVLVLRFCFRRLPRGITMALWILLYLRAVCPIGMSSLVCFVGAWNRQFHRLLRSIGLEVLPDKGLLTGWTYVFQADVKASVPYMVCTVLWGVGMVSVLVYAGLRQRALRLGAERGAQHLYDRVYQSDSLSAPMRTGFFRRRIYLPAGLSAKEMKNIILHEEVHLERHDDELGLLFFFITCIHWWNPFLWLAYYFAEVDREFACDEAVLRRLGPDGQSRYVQDILNMQKEGEAEPPFSFICRSEKGVSGRAQHMLYYERAAAWKGAVAAFVVTVVCFGSFGLSAFQGNRNSVDAAEPPLFDVAVEKSVTEEVIASTEVQAASGEALTLQLVVAQGTYQKGSGYQGQCALMLKDGEDTRANLNLSKVFRGSRRQWFGEEIELAVVDYNEDGVMEAAVGQRASRESAVTATGGAAGGDKSKAVQEYYLIAVEQDRLKVVSEPVYVSGITDLQAGSMVFSYIQGAGGVIQAESEDGISYYVWDDENGKYTRQDMTEREIEQRKEERASKKAPRGENGRHVLQNEDGKEMIGVNTVTDDSGIEVIKKVEMNPEGLDHRTGTKGLTDVEGYYCDLKWAETDGEQERYAVLIYNGARGRTFALYDINSASLCHRQEDGNSELQKLFKKYGDKEIQFGDDGTVVYSLMEITEEDTLKINFAASAQGGVTVRGTYLYDMSDKRANSLQYTREIE